MKRLFNKIKTHYSSKLPFVAYHKPNTDNVSAFFMEDIALSFVSNFKEKGFVFAPFNSDEKAIIFSEEKSLMMSEELQLEAYILQDTILKSDTLSKEKHIKIVKKALEKIKTHELQKVVVSREELLDISEFDLVELYKKLLSSYKNAFVYVWFHPMVGLWLGASPETLLNIEGASFKTMSLAGTQVDVQNKPLIWKSKELEEQQLVTNFIENQLVDIAINLKTSSNLEELIRALHPTPAVCGLPRKLARTFLFENENYDRSFYTGFLGELNLQDSKDVVKSSSLFVNLRCMRIQNNKATIFVGGGITKDSNASNEWEETVSKAKTMKRML